jgi:hypothetical protein
MWFFSTQKNNENNGLNLDIYNAKLNINKKMIFLKSWYAPEKKMKENIFYFFGENWKLISFGNFNYFQDNIQWK